MAQSTQHAVLGLVAREPAHGYAIYAELERWPVPPSLLPGRSTVYRHLERLSAAGLIAAEDGDSGEGEGSRHPERTVFAATPAGHAHLDRVVQSPPRDFDELTIRVGIARAQDLPLLIEYAMRLQQQCLERFQQWSMLPEPCLIAAQPGRPWRSVTRTIQGRMHAANAAGLATILEQIGDDLRELQQTLATNQAGA
ncbi:MAG TPA: PadR family transcriptional regulator [Baekduia sp.]